MKKSVRKRTHPAEELPAKEHSENEAEEIGEQSENDEDGIQDRSENENDSGEEQSPNDENVEDEASENGEEPMEMDGTTSSMKRPKVTPLVKKKKNKAGIVYISSIPRHMNVAILRGLLEPFGEVGRIYLEPERKDGKIRSQTAAGKRAMIRYIEGWVEFVNKRVAKAIAPMLNTKPISTNRKSVFCDILWTMKYLPRFRWSNLSERLAYERAVGRDRLRTEIHQTRAEASVFESALNRSAALKARERARKKALQQEGKPKI